MSETHGQVELRVSAPANLLLMGEYAVLEEGGLGVALAPDIRVRGTVSFTGSAAHDVTVTGHLPGKTATWPGDDGLLGTAAEHLSGQLGLAPRGTEITIDSTPLYGPGGEKRGLGSSAASIVVLTALWMAALRPAAVTAGDTIFAAALGAHRAAQGGRGSGYDVASSTFGGTILFTGGVRPSTESVHLPWMPEVQLLAGPSPVRTVSAVGNYRMWKEDHPARADAFLEESNKLVREFIAAESWMQALPVITRHRELALELGRQIGVPSHFKPPRPETKPERAFVKAVGAGNEIGILISNDDVPDRNREPGRESNSSPGISELVVISGEGLAWE